MPRDSQGAGTRTETKVEWRNVYRKPDGTEFTPMGQLLEARTTRSECEELHSDSPDYWKARFVRIAIERIETTTTITREEL